MHQKSTKPRIPGIDFARALAVWGMVIVNFKSVLAREGATWAKTFTGIFEGKAAATFVVLAGVGIALMTNNALKNNDQQQISLMRKRITKRALLLFAAGLTYISIWPADILHYYGIYLLIVLAFLKAKKPVLLIAVHLFILAYPLLLLALDYESGWHFPTLTYQGFWTIEGFLKNLLFNGFHPVLPWSAFLLFGYWFGKQGLHNLTTVKKAFVISLGAFVTLQGLSCGTIAWLSEGNQAVARQLSEILGTSPMPPFPVYMFSGIAIAVTTITASILLAKRFEHTFIVNAINKTGQLALTFYVAHVVIGMGAIEAFFPTKMGAMTVEFSLLYALGFSLACMLFAMIWSKKFKSGPFEWAIRKATQ